MFSATKPGESFNAELVKLDATGKVKSKTDEDPIEKEYNLIVKFLSIDPFSREMIQLFEYHIREYLMYSQVIPELNRFQATKTDNAFPIQVPEFVYGKCTEKEYVLVIQNLKALNYETNPKENGLNVDQAKLALEHIARLHGISYAYNQSQNFLDKYPTFAFSSKISALFKPVVYVSVDNTVKFLQTLPEFQDIAAKLDSGRSKIPEKFEAMWDDLSRHKMLCLTHGDFWNSNLLFLSDPVEKDGKKSLENISLIDWQISQWSSPMMDLHYLLSTSTTAGLRSIHLESLLQHYHTALTRVSVALGCPIPNWSLDEFKVEYERLALVGLLMGMCLTQGTLSKEGEKINSSQKEETTSCCCHCLCHCLKKSAAKVIVPLAFHPSCNFILQMSIKKLLQPIGRELKTGENKIMNQRLLDLVKEADQKGLFDVLNL